MHSCMPPSLAAARAAITGVATYVPERVLTNAELARTLDTSDDWIVTRTGIRERRMGAPGETTSTMGAEAVRRLHGGARGCGPTTWTRSSSRPSHPDMLFPATACLIQDQLGLSAGLGLRPLRRLLRVPLRADRRGAVRRQRARTGGWSWWAPTS